MSDEDYKKAMEVLQSLRASLSEEQIKIAKMLASYLLANAEKKDYEGKQYFPIENYKRRN